MELPCEMSIRGIWDGMVFVFLPDGNLKKTCVHTFSCSDWSLSFHNTEHHKLMYLFYTHKGVCVTHTYIYTQTTRTLKRVKCCLRHVSVLLIAWYVQISIMWSYECKDLLLEEESKGSERRVEEHLREYLLSFFLPFELFGNF